MSVDDLGVIVERSEPTQAGQPLKAADRALTDYEMLTV
jgi:hypothetical protein